ncbi:SurA N-terminal domain-containing protein [Cerasicoccus frondis]|uniref:SurA N-terminal domain-containing protein n=1 Tax=Cerasicoccus frondis TaxID=490090 RepID=UPI00285282C1|nr:SurA N-terminal domain-containing protein [Cerasicoccus frondis]
MFTWLQTHIQKHHKIIFGIILVVVIISFVFTIGNFGGFGNPTNPNAGPREFYGFNLNSARDVRALEQWTTISLALDRQRISDEAVQYGAMQRAVLLSIVADLQIPEPTQEQFQKYVSERPAFQDWQTGQFSQKMYAGFIDSFKNNPNMSEETLITTLSQDFRIDQVSSALGGPGYVMPYLALEEIKRRDTVWSIDLAELDRDTFEPTIEITDEALEEFYQQAKFRYETKPQIVAEYVSFPAANYIDQVAEPTEAELTTVYNKNRAAMPKTDEGATKPLAEVKDHVTELYKQEKAQELALNDANKFAVALYDAAYEGTVKQNDPSLAAFVSEQGYELKKLPPFSEGNLNVGGVVPASGLGQLLNVHEDRFFTDGGVKTADGAAVLILVEKGATSIPPLADVRDRVVADYKTYEKGRQFNAKAEEAQAELQTAVDDGKDFTEAAEALGFTVKSFDDFTLMSPPKDKAIDNFVLSTVSEMTEGEVSNLVGFSDVGTIVYVKKADVPQISADSEQVVSEMGKIQSQIAMATEASIVNELIEIGNKKLEAEEKPAL